jgi:exosortase/archaeosortase family protein
MSQNSRFNLYRKQYHEFILFFTRIIIVFVILFTAITITKRNPSLDRVFKTSAFVHTLSKVTAYTTKGVLNVLGYQAKVEYTYAYTCIIDQGVYAIYIPNSRGIWLGGHCLGLKLLALFIILIACFPGKLKPKLWYIICGVLLIEMIYISRLVYLTIYSKQIFDSGVSADIENYVVSRTHDNLNTAIYFLVVILFIIFVRYFSQGKGKEKQKVIQQP